MRALCQGRLGRKRHRCFAMQRTDLSHLGAAARQVAEFAGKKITVGPLPGGNIQEPRKFCVFRHFRRLGGEKLRGEFLVVVGCPFLRQGSAGQGEDCVRIDDDGSIIVDEKRFPQAILPSLKLFFSRAVIVARKLVSASRAVSMNVPSQSGV